MRLLWLICIVCVPVTGYSQQMTPDPSLIKSLYFGGGSYYIDDNQAVDVKEFIESFPLIENYTITIHSHTDNIGSPDYNQMLSEMRSYMAIRLLVELKVPEEIISIQDFGEFNPIYDNETHAGRIRNRRVDIILWPPNTL